MEGPTAFLCHGWDDKAVAEQIARGLHAAGIPTFFDKWEIGPGDRLVEKINQGLEDCTHFVALLTQTSIQRPWVKAELDAATIGEIEGSCMLIPLRYELELEAIPPLLRRLHCPSIGRDLDADVVELAKGIYGARDKPPLGPIPSYASVPAGMRGLTLSPNAARLAEFILKASGTGSRSGDLIEVDQVLRELSFSIDDVAEAVDELEELGYVKPQRVLGGAPLGFRRFRAYGSVFIDLDKYVMDWDPKQDAKSVVADLLNLGGAHPGSSVAEIASRLGWEPRRINPAVDFLRAHGHVTNINELGAYPYTCKAIFLQVSGRRFYRSG